MSAFIGPRMPNNSFCSRCDEPPKGAKHIYERGARLDAPPEIGSILLEQRRRLRSARRSIRVRLSAGFAQRAYTHAKEPDAPVERHAFQAFTRRAAYGARVPCRLIEGAVAGEGFEVVVAELESDRLAHVAFSRARKKPNVRPAFGGISPGGDPGGRKRPFFPGEAPPGAAGGRRGPPGGAGRAGQ